MDANRRESGGAFASAVSSPAANYPPLSVESLVGRTLGDYEITGLIGRGGMGLILSGVHPLIGSEVAIKILDARWEADSEALQRFIQEARAANQIRHRNIIEIFAFGSEPEIGHYHIMPRLRGQTLAERIDEEGYFGLEEALPLLAQIAEALDAVHAAGVTHRDLKPENVFLESGAPPTVKILDFGIAKLAASRSMATTETGVLMGTPLFIAPEQWKGEFDHRIDLYAFGVLVHYMLTARYPFEASTAPELMSLHTTAEPTPASEHGAPAFVDAIIARALEKDPDQRIESARALVDLLRTAVDSAADTAALPVSTPAHAGASRRRGWLAAAALVGAAGLVAALAIPRMRGELSVTAPTVPARTSAADLDAAGDVTSDPAGAPAEPARVNLRIDSQPSGARVVIDGELVGVTPLRAAIAARQRAHLELRLGDRVTAIDIPLASDFEGSFELPVASQPARPHATPQKPKTDNTAGAQPAAPQPNARPEPTAPDPVKPDGGKTESPEKTRWGETIKEEF